MSSPAPPPRSYGQKPSIRPQTRYVPKSTTTTTSSSSSSSSSPASADPKPSAPPPTLTASLRGSDPSYRARSRPGPAEKEKASQGDFVEYLPQDEAVASGLGADAGGLDALESQAVVDLLNDELSKLLRMSPREFWKEVARNDSLHKFLDSYLQFRNRWYDLPHRGAGGTVAGVIVGEIELCRRVFMILYRMSSNKDPGASASDCLSMKDHTALLQEKKLLDLPKLLDICAVYGHENGELTRLLVANAMKAQPRLAGNISAVVSHFLNIVHTMHQRFSSSLEVLLSSGGSEDHGRGQLHKDVLEVMDFINDAIVTLDAFADAYKPAALYFSIPFEMSYGNEELLNTLARLHDSLLPSLQQGLARVSSTKLDDAQAGGVFPTVGVSSKLLSARIIKLGWKLLDFCYLHDELIEDNLFQNVTKMFPAKVEDPAIRGDILVQTFREINAEVLYHLQEGNSSGTFLQNVEKNHKILNRIGSLRSNGWIAVDEEQFQYLNQMATPPSLKTWQKESRVPTSLQNDKTQIDEDAIIMESRISQIKDLFPDYGKGFLSACLEVYNQNPEEVIQRILEGTLHEDLLSLDTSLEQIPPPKAASHSKGDKGKGVLVEPVSQSRREKEKGKLVESASQIMSNRGEEKLLQSATQRSILPAKLDPTARARASTISSSSSLSGRYARKSDVDLPQSHVLDSTSAKDAIRSAVLAAEYEYDDEYDDSFDDLGLSVAESGYEATETLTNQLNSFPGKSWGSESESSQSSNSRWSSQKKPQFYVKDGKNYSYKVSGSVAVNNSQEAALVNQAQKEVIHGLGRGGNIPLGAVKKLIDAEEQNHQIPDAADNSGRGSPGTRGRGGRRGGGGNHYRKDRAMKKHFSGLGGF